MDSSVSVFISAPDEDVLVKGKQTIKSQALGNQNSESEIPLEGDDDTLSSIEEKELENLTGKVSCLFLPLEWWTRISLLLLLPLAHYLYSLAGQWLICSSHNYVNGRLFSNLWK